MAKDSINEAYEAIHPDRKIDGKLSSRTLHVLFWSLLIDLIAFSSILPLMPVILEYYRDNDSVKYIFSLEL